MGVWSYRSDARFSVLAKAALGSVTNAGTLFFTVSGNADKHFVPITSNPLQTTSYAAFNFGSQDAISYSRTGLSYKLGDTEYGTNKNYNLRWIRVTNTLYILDRCIFNNITWDQANNLVNQLNEGGYCEIDGVRYKAKLLKDDGDYYSVNYNEESNVSDWGKLRKVCQDNDSIMHWRNMLSFTGDLNRNGNGHVIRGGDFAWYWNYTGGSDFRSDINDRIGFRPALELVE